MTFVDSSALYAVIDDRDPNHAAAGETLRFLIDAERLITHNYVLVESLALLQRRLGAEAARALFDGLLPVLEVEWVDRDLHHLAATAAMATGSRRASLVDWASFGLMRARGIVRAFAFDRDFAAQGFTLIPAPQASDASAISR